MRIGIHQPNFLPWMGYFYKMAQCDTFVLLDHIEFTKRSYTKRVKIHKTNNWVEDQYITVPLKKHSDHAPINSLQLVDDTKWQKKISAQIYQTYHKAPFYSQIESFLKKFFEEPLQSNSFSDFTIDIIKYIAELFELESNFIISSELKIDYSKSNVNLDIISQLDAHTYVSGMGAKKYQNEEMFTNRKITLEYSDFPSHFENWDMPDHFLNKSILSYLANYEIQEIRRLLLMPSTLS